MRVVRDLATGRLARLDAEPGRRSDAASAAAAGPPPPGPLAVFDLGYFDLDRPRRWSRARRLVRLAAPARHRGADLDGTPIDLDWREVVVLYRARWRVELLFKLWKSHGRPAAEPAGSATPGRAMAELWDKLIAAVVRHRPLLASAWPDAPAT